MNKRMISAFVAAGLAAMTLAAPAFAEDDAHDARIAKRVDDVFARLDADKDGKISKAEASKGPRLSKKFDAVDADHDGFVTRAELTAAFARHAHAKQPAPAAPGQPG
jgi:Ca2+-binding EF-hand superfamily protein